MIQLLFKLFLSPEDILGIVLNILSIIAMCFVFVELKEKWWKALIPFYEIYIQYKLAWKHKWFCIFEFVFVFLQGRCLANIKKEIFENLYVFIISLIHKQPIQLDINFISIWLSSLGFLVFGFLILIFHIITFYKISKKLSYNTLQTICVIISPVFFLVFILWRKWKNKKANKKIS